MEYAEYFIEVDADGCKECAHGKTYRVVKPDASMCSTTYEDHEDAKDLAAMLNEAMEFGKTIVAEGEHPSDRRIKIIQAIRPKNGGAWKKSDLLSIGISYPPKSGWLSKYLLGENPNE